MIGAYETQGVPRLRLYAALLAVPALAAALAFAGLADSIGASIVPLALGLWVVFGMTVDASLIAEGRPPVGVLVVVIVLPFVHIVLPWGGWGHVFQVAIAAQVVFYLSLLPPRLRVDSVRRSLPLFVPVLLLVSTVIVSYSLSAHVDKYDRYGLLELTCAAALVLLAAVYCRSLPDLERLLCVFIVGGMLQLPIVIGQAVGLMDSLPGGLGQLSPANWGGSLANAGASGGGAVVLRYAGSFGSAENFAEYCGILVLLSLGLCLFEPSRSKAMLFALAAAAAIVTGVFTGTRSFVLGVAGGASILLLEALLLAGPRVTRLWRLVAGTVLGAIAVLWLVPGSVTAGFLSRFQSSDFSLTSPNALNRLPLYKAWIRLAHEMPWFGYGTAMSSAVQAGYPEMSIGWPHSLYFWALLTSGFLGLVALCIVIVMVIYLPVRTATLHVTSRYRQLGCVFAAVAIYWSVNEAKIEFVRLTFYVDLVFLLFGMIASLYVLSRDAVATPDKATGERRLPRRTATAKASSVPREPRYRIRACQRGSCLLETPTHWYTLSSRATMRSGSSRTRATSRRVTAQLRCKRIIREYSKQSPGKCVRVSVLDEQRLNPVAGHRRYPADRARHARDPDHHGLRQSVGAVLGMRWQREHPGSKQLGDDLRRRDGAQENHTVTKPQFPDPMVCRTVFFLGTAKRAGDPHTDARERTASQQCDCLQQGADSLPGVAPTGAIDGRWSCEADRPGGRVELRAHDLIVRREVAATSG